MKIFKKTSFKKLIKILMLLKPMLIKTMKNVDLFKKTLLCGILNLSKTKIIMILINLKTKLLFSENGRKISDNILGIKLKESLLSMVKKSNKDYNLMLIVDLISTKNTCIKL